MLNEHMEEATMTLPPTQLLPERDAARYIGMSRDFLRHQRMHGRGPAYARLGRSVRYRIGDLESWLDARMVRSRDAA